MSLNPNTKQKKSKPEAIKKGTYPARLVQLIDLGVQPQTDMNGVEKEPAPEVWLTLEFPTKRIEVNEESRPRWVSKRIKNSWHEKANFPKWMEVFGYVPKKTKHLSELLSAPCLAAVGLTSGGNNKIENVLEVPEGMIVGELENDPKVFDFDDPDMEVFNSLPSFLQDIIISSPSFSGSELESKLVTGSIEDDSTQSDEFEDDIPF